jgi:large subunit ribosomal protein L6
MSRVGKHPIQIPSGVNVTINGNVIEASGKLGKLSRILPEGVIVEHTNSAISVKPANESKQSRMLWGTIQRQISNMINGVANGTTINLDLVGVGYRASVQGQNINVQLGFSHDVVYPIPQGITIKCEKPTSIAITGADKQLVGQVAAEIRKHRQPEPYKGKGIIREGEFVVRKEGKKK